MIHCRFQVRNDVGSDVPTYIFIQYRNDDNSFFLIYCMYCIIKHSDDKYFSCHRDMI